MSEHNEQVVRRGIDELWNGGRTEIIAEIAGPGYVRRDPSLPHPANGPRGLEQSVALLRNAFPDLHNEIVEMHSAGDVVVTRWRATGTHRGDLMGIMPTGKRVDVTGLTLYRFSDGRMTDEITEWDQVELLRNLGVIPERESTQEKALRTFSNLRTKVADAIGR